MLSLRRLEIFKVLSPFHKLKFEQAYMYAYICVHIYMYMFYMRMLNSNHPDLLQFVFFNFSVKFNK